MAGYRNVIIMSGALIALMLGGATAASADTEASLHGGVLNGTQVNVPIAVPINVCGNAIAVLGAPCIQGGGTGQGGAIDEDANP
ncbi:chaplin family protein [Streptomyces ehimensis]|uniref:Chaplin family protein n=1 Tax=Streptomyces ehimensis TaxID=68195 RepID=A0ABV9BTS9_9ACTN